MQDEDIPSDDVIIARVLCGEIEAFRYLIRRYQNRYIRFAVRMTGAFPDAEEALQSAFTRAYRHLRRCHQPDRFGVWFHQIVVNECRTMAVRRARYDHRFTNDLSLLADLPAPVPHADREFADDVQRALDRLPPDQREAVLLKYAEGMSYEEMAAVTGATVSALKMRAKRGLAGLQDFIPGVSYAD